MADDKKKKGGGDEGGQQAPKAKPQLDEAEIAKKRAERAAKKAGKGGGAAQVAEESQATGEKPGPARLRVLFEKELAATLMKELGLKNAMQVPRLKKITINMGLGEAISNPKIMDTRRRGAARHHRPAAGGDQGEEVDRDLQAPRGAEDRRDGDAAPRPHVRVPRSPGHAGAAARA